MVERPLEPRRFGGFQKEVAVGLWIHDRLMEFGEDYTERMWREFAKEASAIPLRRRRKIAPEKGGGYRRFYKPPSYLTFQKYMYALRRAGLIEFTREEEVEIDKPQYASAMPRRYFKIVDGREFDPMWNNPQEWAYLK